MKQDWLSDGDALMQSTEGREEMGKEEKGDEGSPGKEGRPCLKGGHHQNPRGIFRQRYYTSREVHGKFTSQNGCSCRRFWRSFSFDAKDYSRSWLALVPCLAATCIGMYQIPGNRIEVPRTCPFTEGVQPPGGGYWTPQVMPFARGPN